MPDRIPDSPPTPSAPRRRWTGWRLAGLGGGSVFLLVAAFGVFQWATWPDVASLATNRPKTTAFIEAYRSAGDTAPLVWQWVAGDDIADDLWKAVVVAEDVEFFTHEGFSVAEIRAAIRQAWDERRAPRGASTITQQLAKNLWLSPSRNPWRKVKEALLTRSLERHLSKRRILELYLNVVEFGTGVFGAEAAARHYFDKPASSLTRREAALLAASLPRPGSWHPGVTRSGYLASADRIEARTIEFRDYLERHLHD